MKENKWIKILLIVASHILVAALAVSATLWLTMPEKPSKLDTLQDLLAEKYIGEADQTAMEDAAANAMVEAMGDRWSYYIPASSYASHMEQKKNAYVGIGITITVREDGIGFDVTRVEPGGPAQEAGVLPGDILTHAEGQPVAEMGTDGAANVIKGEEGTMVNVTFLRGDQVLELTMERRTIQQAVAEWQMLPGNIGYIEINNFNTNCADQTIQAVEELTEQGYITATPIVSSGSGEPLDGEEVFYFHEWKNGCFFSIVEEPVEEPVEETSARFK